MLFDTRFVVCMLMGAMFFVAPLFFAIVAGNAIEASFAAPMRLALAFAYSVPTAASVILSLACIMMGVEYARKEKLAKDEGQDE